MAQLALEAMWAARKAADMGNANAVIDAAVAGQMGLAAVEGAALNVRVNLISMKDTATAQEMRQKIGVLVSEARALHAEIVSIAQTRAGLSQ